MLLPASLPLPAVLATTSLLLVTLLVHGVAGECEVEGCGSAYVAAKEAGVEEASTPAYCSLVQTYIKCMDEQKPYCRGNIQFHSIQRMLPTFLTKYNCSQVLEEELYSFEDADGGSPTAKDPKQTQDVCRYLGDVAPAHCGLFGDPHLKTFSGEYMTCGVRGAWPLLNTPYLAIQVTNDPVGPAHHATATTKVTVIIKGHTMCGSERTYEASSDALPKAFVDGTTWSGGSRDKPYTQVQESRPGEHVLITISYINATVAVRMIGRYLTVLVTLPESVLGEVESEDELQLCLQGCPAYERLDTPGASPLAVAAMTKEKAAVLCKEYNVTDYYLDSCIFDLVTTGDSSFRVAAQAAQNDLWKHDPAGAQRLLHNCSEPPCVWEMSSGPCDDPCRAVILLSLITALLVRGGL